MATNSIHTSLGPTFEEHLTTAFQEVRRTLADLVAASGVDPGQPQELARRLSINRNLTWKISKVLCSPDLYESIQHLPGEEGLEILVAAARAVGVSDEVASKVRTAQQEFGRLVEIHTGDRGTLELILDNLGGAGSAERLEQSRRLAFRGNSGIWGVQARARMAMAMVRPSDDDPTGLTVALAAGILDFRRLRHNVRWPLFRPVGYDGNGQPLPQVGEAIDAGNIDPAGPQFIADFCSPRTPPVRRMREPAGLVYMLDEGPIGNLGALSCVFGTIKRQDAARYRTPDEPFGDFFAQITMPVENLNFDVFVHRDLDHWGAPDALLVGQGTTPVPDVEHSRIPLGERAQMLSGHPPVVHTPLMSRYEHLVDRLVERVGRPLREFRVFRLTLKYPPMHACALMRFNLPARP